MIQNRSLFAFSVVTVLSACAGGRMYSSGPTVAAMGADAASVAVSDGHLVDGMGMSLYLFEPDKMGASTCYEACASAWPPLITKGAPTASGDAKAAMLGTTVRKDGAMQVTYNGWPLYDFVRDKMAGDTAGQAKKGFGGEWYLVEPSGHPMEEQKESGSKLESGSGSGSGSGY